MNVEDYKNNPCRLSALPYWKSKSFKMPPNMVVVHNDEYHMDLYSLSIDTIYFRLKHNLKVVEEFLLEEPFKYKKVNINFDNDLNDVVSIINKCYTDIKVNLEQVISWTKLEVFNENLWIFIIDNNTNKPVGLGIAELDKTVREGMIEWIQILPTYRGIKLGQAIVNKLLLNFSNHVDFVTVSGRVNNKTKPEKLYRRCGFEGKDIWHIINRKEK